jgi:hypothetical protein
MWKRALIGGTLVTGAWMSSSCAPTGFADETLVATVRILASSSEPAYAQPGSSVDVQVLAYDGRPSQPEPMSLYWLPFLCEDPADDAYYACFTQTGGDGGIDEPADAGDGGAGFSLGALRPGVDLTPFLPTGPSYQFTMPQDVVSRHTAVAGEPAPYGLGILFNVACAGHLELLPSNPSNDNPQQVPIGCFDSSENQLGPDDWVLGFTRVYAFDPDAGADGGPITNANPVISSIDVQGSPLSVVLSPGTTQVYTTQTFTTSHCTADRRSNCPHVAIGPVVPESSWTLLDPPEYDVNHNPEHKEIWADFYSTFGQFTGDAGLLYDSIKGSLGDPSVTDNQFLPPDQPGNGFIWIVVHDNQGGASWVTIPVQVN